MSTVSRPFSGATITKVFARSGPNAHTGTDYVKAGPHAINAPVAGVVKAIGHGPLWGKISLGWDYGYWIAISDDNGMVDFIAHNGTNQVHAGQRVARGQEIALSGASGNETGIHTHWSVYGVFPNRATLIDSEVYRKDHGLLSTAVGAVTAALKPAQEENQMFIATVTSGDQSGKSFVITDFTHGSEITSGRLNALKVGGVPIRKMNDTTYRTLISQCETNAALAAAK